MTNELTGKVIFLTGGGQGIGRECAKAYARAGATVVVADLNLAGADATVADLPGTGHLALHCNVASGPSVQAALADDDLPNSGDWTPSTTTPPSACPPSQSTRRPTNSGTCSST